MGTLPRFSFLPQDLPNLVIGKAGFEIPVVFVAPLWSIPRGTCRHFSANSLMSISEAPKLTALASSTGKRHNDLFGTIGETGRSYLPLGVILLECQRSYGTFSCDGIGLKDIYTYRQRRPRRASIIDFVKIVCRL